MSILGAAGQEKPADIFAGFVDSFDLDRDEGIASRDFTARVGAGLARDARFELDDEAEVAVGRAQDPGFGDMARFQVQLVPGVRE